MVLFMMILCSWLQSEPTSASPYRTFSFEIDCAVQVSPEVAFDAFTGDISKWWDHSFSEKPFRLFIEPKPGGGFFEYFDAKGNGVKHASVIACDRGKLLRLDGALGLAGKAIQMVHTIEFKAMPSGGTQVICTVRAAGEVADGIPALVEQVWRHFLIERYKPYVEKGAQPSLP